MPARATKKACAMSGKPPVRLEQLIRVLRSHLPQLRESYGVQGLEVFGSYVRREEGKKSDLDLLVEFDDRPLSLIQFIELEHYLGDLLGVKVDLVEKGVLKPAIGRRILEEVVPV